MEPKNLRTLEVTTESGKEVDDTQQLKGGAHLTAPFKDKNETKQYTTGKPKNGALGGENTNS